MKKNQTVLGDTNLKVLKITNPKVLRATDPNVFTHPREQVKYPKVSTPSKHTR